ncbi:MAG TPA: flagellar basal body-associated FliL family protein [Holophaga sp.]|nr:flagellar basal body-associated FliL family protein [Holophaga sp.]HPS67456.1 flagellar basal body-associated FliL family protein [Holophaga sp.]
MKRTHMAEQEPQEKKPKAKMKPKLKKLIIVVGGGLLVLALLGGGGYYGWNKWQAHKAAKAAAAQPGAAAAAEAEEEEEPSEEEGGNSPVLIYKNNVNVEGMKNAYLVVEFNLLFRDNELGRLVTSDKPTPENSIMRAIILDAISGKSMDEISDVESREVIRQDILDRLNERFAPKPPKPGEEKKEGPKKPKRPVKDVLVVAWAIAQ